MKIAFTIISINDRCEDNKTNIRQILSDFDELTNIPFVNAHDIENLKSVLKRWPDIRPKDLQLKVGEIGVWFSQVESWNSLLQSEYDALLVFEDDAKLSNNFVELLYRYLNETPPGFDFISLSVPENQRQDFSYKIVYDKDGVPKSVTHPGDKGYEYTFGSDIMSRVYQGYCCVATLYSRKGAEKFLELAKKYGTYTPVDCFLFLQAHMGNVEGYSPRPEAEMAVSIDWDAPTTIHCTGLFHEDLYS